MCIIVTNDKKRENIMKEKSILALKLKQLRREKNVTSEEVANAVGIKPATYRRYEIDTNPKRETFVKLSEYFGVSIDYLVGNEEVFSFRTESPNINKEKDKLSTFELLMIRKIRALDEDKLSDLLKFLDGCNI
mgnify:FL=1